MRPALASAEREDTQNSSPSAALATLEVGARQEETPGAEPSPSDAFLRDLARIDEAPPPPAALVGKRLAHFEVKALLGRGGMGVVYLARDLRLGREVALKLLRGGDARLAPRLLREARAQARVDHPNVCKVFEVGEAEGQAYIAMEVVHGPPLGEVAERMSLPQKVEVVRDVARALHAAHVLGIVHRDVKPSNVLVETREDGALHPVVMDFGIARDEAAGRGHTETGDVIGTPAYMSPEQMRGDLRALDRRSDVYSLGATFYELLAGAPPFGGGPMAMVRAALEDEPPPLHARVRALPLDLGTMVAKCLRKEPDQRYDSARALAEDLDRYIRGEPILGRRESLLSRARRRASKHRALVILGALALSALGTSVGLGVRARIAARRQAAELAAQAELGRELGQDVKDMEWFLRSAHQRPLHDLTHERAIVKENMKLLSARAVAGPLAAAQVDYAVGRGHLALDEPAEAALLLSRAEQAGLDTPELDYALGLARGRLYQDGVIAAQRLPDAASIEQRVKELEAEDLEPAVASMEKSRGVRLEAPSYLPALLSFYRKDYEDALRLAVKAEEEAPWLYEALALQADVRLAQGTSEVGRDKTAALKHLEEAARLYDAAAEEGRSDASLYLGGAEAWVQHMSVEAEDHTRPEDSLARALDRAERAARVRPDLRAPHLETASALEAMALYLLNVGADPRPLLTRALAAVDRAIAVGGEDVEVQISRTRASWIRAGYEASRGRDAIPAIDAFVAAAQRVVDLAPMYAAGQRLLTEGLSSRAWYVMDTGGDPEPDLRAALDSRDRGYAPDEIDAYITTLFVYQQLACYRAIRGRDPSPEVALATAAFTGCVQAHAGHPGCYRDMAAVEQWLAEYQIDAGLPARETLSRALEHAERARAIEPDDYGRVGMLADIQLLRARDAIRLGEDPSPALEASAADLADCKRRAPENPWCAVVDARRALLLADVDLRAGRPERAALERARELAQRAVELRPSKAHGHEVLAEAELRLAALAAPPADQAGHRAAGLDACARGLAINPSRPRLLATKGALLLLEARAAHDAGAKADSAQKALSALRRAVELNPLLRREVGELLDEADRLAG